MESYYREIADMLLSQHTQTILTPAMSNNAIATEVFSYTNEGAPILACSAEGKVDSFTKSYISFSGCDIVVSLGADVVGEVSSITYHETTQVLANLLAKDSIYCDRNMVKNYPNVVVVKFTLFNKEYWHSDKEVDITLSYANEYGQKAMKSIVGCVPLFRYGGASIDSVVTESIVVYAAKKIFPMEEAT